MATHHAAAGEVVDLRTWANDLKVEKSKVITKTTGVELARLVIDAGVDMHHTDYCSVKGAVVIHCLEGEITLKTSRATKSIGKGQLVYLDGDTEHALVGVLKSVVLLTIVLPQK
jgi:quercetin dioxygenase-like cupin family protein